MPEQCNAQIDVGGETLSCVDTAGHYSKIHTAGTVQWTDRAPGACAPGPRYRVIRVEPPDADTYWEVIEVPGGESSYFAVAKFMGGHPDPLAAARAEADRLNGHNHA